MMKVGPPKLVGKKVVLIPNTYSCKNTWTEPDGLIKWGFDTLTFYFYFLVYYFYLSINDRFNHL